MEDMNYTIARINLWIWGILGFACLAGVICYGAWWHIGTVLICFAMFMGNYEDAKKLESDLPADKKE